MDDFVPCKRGRPNFTKANGNELWAIMLEKAWSKVHGSYERTSGGFPHLAMRDMTGAPSWKYDITDDKEAEILDWDKKGYMMCAAVIKKDLGLEEKQDTGIANQHAYGLVAAKKINFEGSSLTLVQLRNPWGNYEWNGEWSDKSDLWTPELKKQCGWTDKDDGLFWMSFADFK